MDLLIGVNIALKVLGVILLLLIFVKVNHLIHFKEKLMTTLSDFEAVGAGIDAATEKILAYVQSTGGMSPADQAQALNIVQTAVGNLVAAIPSGSSTVEPITGNFTLGVSATSQLADATPGGTWSSNDSNTATVDSTGLVTGVAQGTATITYTVGSASATASVTII